MTIPGMAAGTDFHLVVVGSGIAGLYSALLAAEAGLSVTLVTKGQLAESNTHHAQGGICAVLAEGEATPGDTVEAHIADTLKAGAGRCNPAAVRILCEEAVGDIAALERFGVAFDTDPATGRRALGLEGAHSAARILHAGGDATGAAIAEGLISAIRLAEAAGTITVLERTFVLDLLEARGSVGGVVHQSGSTGPVELRSDGVLLATGGAGQLYGLTTNPAVATADGVALAWRAGAMLADLEYFQFHPTALAAGDGFLISEAVRGAGAVIRDAQGTAFMVQYHPDGDLAPRDVVSRSIAAHLADGHSGDTVYLDATGVEASNGSGYLRRRFPTIDAKTRQLGFDWTREWLPVTPAAHYWMGGVATDLGGETSVAGLYAAGEVACTGVHGANRLASNSLLEGLVFGRRAVKSAIHQALSAESFTRAPNTQIPWMGPGRAASPRVLQALPAVVPTDTAHPGTSESGSTHPGTALLNCASGTGMTPFSQASLGLLMSTHAGVVRDGAGLRHAASVLAGWRCELLEGFRWHGRPAARKPGEELNLLCVAELLVHQAMARQESVGAHFRRDHPNTAPGAEADTAPGAEADTAPGAGDSTNYIVAGRVVRRAHLSVRESETV